MSSGKSLPRLPYLLALGLVLLTGMFLRLPPALFETRGPLRVLAPIHPTPGYDTMGFDENLYRGYVNTLVATGLENYPLIVEHYIEFQKTLVGSILPPMRFFYIFSAYLWHQIFGTEALAALQNVASFFGMLSLLLATACAWRLKDAASALAVAAFIAFSPTQLHMSQHALVDGIFAFWAVLTIWTLWENLRAPRNWRWLLPYTLTLAVMVMTKENTAFVYFAVLVLLLTNRWLKWGSVTRELLACTVLGPLLGVVVLIFLAGGLGTLISAYQLSVAKNYHLVYAIVTGDGPWYRYIVDLLLVSPIIVLLALGAIFRLQRTQKPELFLAVFIGASYLVMCNLRYGMNLRYATMWDVPLSFLAFSQLTTFVRPLAKYRTVVLGAAVAALCVLEMRQYLILFVNYGLYELVSEGLLRALNILKSFPPH